MPSNDPIDLIEEYTATLHYAGRVMVEAACEMVLKKALETAAPEAVIEARMETHTDCCGGSGYRIVILDKFVSVSRCPCLKISIVTTIPKCR